MTIKRFNSILNALKYINPAITILDADIFRNEVNIFKPPNPPIFFLKAKNSRKKLKIPDMAVASARPLIFKKNISMAPSATFSTKDTLAIFTGVNVSFSE